MLGQKARDHEAPKIYSHEYYQRLYDLEERHWWSIGMRAIGERLLDPHLQNHQGLRILDAGCGTGGTLSWLERYTDARNIFGIDFSRFALKFCQARRSHHLAQGSVTDLPFPNEFFDLVVCMDVLQHLPRDGADRLALQEFQRVVKPGGLIYLRTNDIRQGPGTGTGEPRAHVSARDDYHRYSRDELAGVLDESGFNLERLTAVNMLPALFSTWVRRLNPRRPRHSEHSAGHRYEGLAQRVPPLGLNAVLTLVALGEARYLAKPRRTLPYGHSLICLATKPASS